MGWSLQSGHPAASEATCTTSVSLYQSQWTYRVQFIFLPTSCQPRRKWVFCRHSVISVTLCKCLTFLKVSQRAREDCLGTLMESKATVMSRPKVSSLWMWLFSVEGYLKSHQTLQASQNSIENGMRGLPEDCKFRLRIKAG